MIIIKGFVGAPSLLLNTSAVGISGVGELSKDSQTYSKEINISTIKDPVENELGLDLYIFSSYDKETLTNFTVTDYIKSKITTLSNLLFSESMGSDLSYNNGDAFVTVFNQLLTVNNINGITVTEIGDWVEYLALDGVSQCTMPSKLILNIVENGEDHEFILWTSDSFFSTEYPDYEIHGVLPVADLDDFFNSALEVKALLQTTSASQYMSSIKSIINQSPDTSTDILEFEWNDPNSSTKLVVNWPIVIYGVAGENIENIKKYLRKLILDNSLRSENDWKVIFPDIFSDTVFYVIPDYASVAIPNETIKTGLNSPTINLSRYEDINQMLQLIQDTSDETHILTNLVSTIHTYKSTALFILGDAGNNDDVYNFKTLWSDYITLPSTSPDFSRMAPDTQLMQIEFNAAIREAESMTNYNTLPAGMIRVFKNGYLFLGININNVQYLFLSRSSFEVIDGLIDDIVTEPDVPDPDPIPDPDPWTLLGEPMILNITPFTNRDVTAHGGQS